jgi:hypothetical protein
MSHPTKSHSQKERAAPGRRLAADRPAARAGESIPGPPGLAPQPLTDPAANAALALAVTSARRLAQAARAMPLPREAAKADAAPRAAGLPPGENRPSLPRRLGAVAAVAAVTVLASAGGWLGGRSMSVGPSPPETALARAEQHLRESQADVKALRIAVASLEDSLSRSLAEGDRRRAELVERVERLPQESLAGLARLGEDVRRLEAAAGPLSRLAGLSDQIGRIERSLSGPVQAAPAAAATGPAVSQRLEPSDGPNETGSTEVRPVLAEAAVDGWVLHDVYDGVALIEGRNRRLLEVAPGESVPGVGRVEAIERRGRRWVVVTAKGVISPAR